MRPVIVITHHKSTENFTFDLIESIKTDYDVLIVDNSYDLNFKSKYKIIHTNDGFELGALKLVYQIPQYEEFFLLQNTTIIKNNNIFNLAFEKYKNQNYCLSQEPYLYGMYLGKYLKKVLDKINIPLVKNKMESVNYEQRFNRLYKAMSDSMGIKTALHQPPLVKSTNFINKHGRNNMILENDVIKKYKATWNRNQIRKI